MRVHSTEVWETLTRPLVERGETASKTALERFLTERDGHRCVRCENTMWMNRPIPLVINRVDGNRKNNKPGNLRFLCANCDSQAGRPHAAPR